MSKIRFAIGAFLVAGMATMVSADDTKKPDSKGEVKKADIKGEKPKASPGWVVIEEDWSYPFLADFSTIMHDARERYRAKEEKAASVEIDKAICWLNYAQGQAAKPMAEDLSTACSDLTDFSAALKSGKPVLAKNLDAAFAHASVALAKHFHFRSVKAVIEGDLKTAGRHLMAATDLLRCAAQSANTEYGAKAVAIYDDYAPFGYWDDTIVFEKSKLESNLATVGTELEKLAAKLKAGK